MGTNGDFGYGRDETIRVLRQALKIRSGRDWSVTGGRGTAWGWIKVNAPPRRRRFDWNGYGEGSNMGAEDREMLGRLLGQDGPVHPQGESIPASTDYYREYLNRAIWGDPCGVHAQPYWD
jgi:hypothetical protein